MAQKSILICCSEICLTCCYGKSKMSLKLLTYVQRNYKIMAKSVMPVQENSQLHINSLIFTAHKFTETWKFHNIFRSFFKSSPLNEGKKDETHQTSKSSKRSNTSDSENSENHKEKSVKKTKASKSIEEVTDVKTETNTSCDKSENASTSSSSKLNGDKETEVVRPKSEVDSVSDIPKRITARKRVKNASKNKKEDQIMLQNMKYEQTTVQNGNSNENELEASSNTDQNVEHDSNQTEKLKDETDSPASDHSVPSNKRKKDDSDQEQKESASANVDSDDDEKVSKSVKKKRKVNVITDDSPVKVSPKKQIKSEKQDGDENENEKSVEENEDETQPVNSFFAPKKKKSKSSETANKAEKSPKGSKPSNTTGASSGTAKDIYDPSKSHYHPINDACWKVGEKVPYLALARTLEEIENISARLKKIEIMANYFRSVIALSPDDLLPSIYLCLNSLAPEYESIELGIGETLLMQGLAQATGRTLDKIKAEVAVKGDLGLIAESSRGKQRLMFAPPKLTVSSVFSKFKEIALMTGNASMSKKVDKVQALFVACRHCEARYIIRSLSGKLRIGLAEQSVLSALTQAAVLTPPNQPYPPKILNSSSSMSAESFKKKLEAQTLILKTTYCECPNYDIIIPILIKKGLEDLPNHCYLTPGIPLKPMLAHPTKGIDEVLRRFDQNEFTCEFKYDGERSQIHVMDSGEVRIYSRNQENNTSKYPDVVSRLRKALKPEVKNCIIDSEAVAWDRQANQVLPFQVLSTRKRKDAVESEITVQVCIIAFDLLYLNGESLVKKPLKERRKLLREHCVEVSNEFMFAQSTDGNNADTMQEFLDESIKGNCEGLMVKSLEVDATYEIAKRSHNWLKLKKDYLEGVGDTLDLVVIGGFHGKGKRTGWYGGFLLACYDNENEEFQTICKLGTGFKEEDLETHASFLKQHVISEPKSYFSYDSSLKPDVWFEPVQVWEVKCADLSISPVHKAAAGIVDPEKGISLRFPRFLRIRDDKKPEEATSSSQVAHLYRSQEQIQNQKGNETKLDEEDFY